MGLKDKQHQSGTNRAYLSAEIDAIKFRMEQGGLTPKYLVPTIGKRNRFYKVLNRKRGLTPAMIWCLHTELGIPAESWIRPLAHV